MQVLECAVCATSPLEAPRLEGNTWRALCPGCGASNRLEADITHVFRPVRFRVLPEPLSVRPRDDASGALPRRH